MPSALIEVMERGGKIVTITPEYSVQPQRRLLILRPGLGDTDLPRHHEAPADCNQYDAPVKRHTSPDHPADTPASAPDEVFPATSPLPEKGPASQQNLTRESTRSLGDDVFNTSASPPGSHATTSARG
jgi:hypothetical protein